MVPLEKKDIKYEKWLPDGWVGGVVEMALSRELLGPTAEQSFREAMGNLLDRANQGFGVCRMKYMIWE